ncbi:hypothetical protein BU14_2577s0001 [Porphyra umbilicalis]|uniref:Uncharacterized protein n=1 Tax=Porphyra umbilicalis TaxID=2786 RepID=A0A1X6NJ37_PORUM|nr:hypothetical protein BU14_2577s0001 [Porphyra umbilicalis]|eukprot:OSX68562.1 hypothetical protein BU14_2577s0001 [Porphyra umbilicalis]
MPHHEHGHCQGSCIGSCWEGRRYRAAGPRVGRAPCGFQHTALQSEWLREEAGTCSARTVARLALSFRVEQPPLWRSTLCRIHVCISPRKQTRACPSRNWHLAVPIWANRQFTHASRWTRPQAWSGMGGGLWTNGARKPRRRRAGGGATAAVKRSGGCRLPPGFRQRRCRRGHWPAGRRRDASSGPVPPPHREPTAATSPVARDPAPVEGLPRRPGVGHWHAVGGGEWPRGRRAVGGRRRRGGAGRPPPHAAPTAPTAARRSASGRGAGRRLDGGSTSGAARQRVSA